MSDGLRWSDGLSRHEWEAWLAAWQRYSLLLLSRYPVVSSEHTTPDGQPLFLGSVPCCDCGAACPQGFPVHAPANTHLCPRCVRGRDAERRLLAWLQQQNPQGADAFGLAMDMIRHAGEKLLTRTRKTA